MAFRSEFVKLSLPIPDGIAMIHDGWIALTVAAVADVVMIEEPLIKYRQHGKQQIGAPSRKHEAEEPNVMQAFRRRNNTADLHKILATLEERLVAQSASYDTRNALSFVGRLLISSECSRQLAAEPFESSAKNFARAYDPALSRIRKRL